MSSALLAKRPAWGSRTESVYEKLEMIGKGTFGKVYKAKDRETKEYVAMKMVRMENEVDGFPITAIREIKILKELHNKNIVNLKDIVTGMMANKEGGIGSSHSIYLVFEFMDHDLTGLLDSPARNYINEPEAKAYMKQLLAGLDYLHRNRIIHRDIKASNLLINNRGILKIADFGLARPISDEKGRRYTNKVCTLWYRPPELLLGEQEYGPEIDMWSAGCIMIELLDKHPAFPANNEILLLEMIFKLVGTPTQDSWPEISNLPNKQFIPSKTYPSRIEDRYSKFSKPSLDLVKKLLCCNPRNRMSAIQACDDEWFWVSPFPAKEGEMPEFPSSHEYTAKMRRKKRDPVDRNALKRPRDPQGGPADSRFVPQPPHAMGNPQRAPMYHQPPQQPMAMPHPHLMPSQPAQVPHQAYPVPYPNANPPSYHYLPHGQHGQQPSQMPPSHLPHQQMQPSHYPVPQQHRVPPPNPQLHNYPQQNPANMSAYPHQPAHQQPPTRPPINNNPANNRLPPPRPPNPNQQRNNALYPHRQPRGRT